MGIYTDRFGLIGVYDAFGLSNAGRKKIKGLTNKFKNLFTKYNHLLYTCGTLSVNKGDIQFYVNGTEYTMKDIEEVENINIHNLYLAILHDLINDMQLYCVYLGIKDDNNTIYSMTYNHIDFVNVIQEDFKNLENKLIALCMGWKDKDYRITVYNCLDIDLDEEDYCKLRDDIIKLINLAAQFKHTYEFIDHHFQLDLTKLKSISMKQMLINDIIKKLKVLKTINKIVGDRLSKFKIIYDCDIVREIRRDVRDLLESHNFTEIDEDELVTKLDSIIDEALIDYIL